MKLSVVIPAYNEAPNIETVLRELLTTIGKCPDVTSYEITVVDDHSDDGTFSAVASMGNSGIRCIRLSRRSGSHTAIRAGLRASTGDAVLCLSADGQDNPVVLNEMIRQLREGSHTVWAVRESRDESLMSRFTAWLFYRMLMTFASGGADHIDLANADFYMLSRRTVDAINQCGERNTSLFGLIIWLGFRQTSVQYQRRERIGGRSKWNFSSRMRLAIDWIIAFSGIPLKLITVIGIGTAFLGFLYAIFLFICALLDYTTPGWAGMVIITLVLSGTIMIMVGLIGEYLWRTLEESRERPLYFIEDETRSDQAK
jgi:polyisoprenyl-phosphate glycosyltransferase